MALEVSTFDPADYLVSDEDIACYLEAAMEGGDAQHFARALETVARARGITQGGEQPPLLDGLARVLSAAGLRLRVDRLAA